MRRYPSIVLASTIVTAPVLAGKQTIEIADDGGNPEQAKQRKQDAERHILPLLQRVLQASMECLHFGFWLQELVWDRKDGMTVPVDAYSFLPGEALLYRDKTIRRFVGYKVQQEFRDARYGFLAVNEPWIDPLFGYSRNENCREQWWRIQQSNKNADKTEKKASSIQMMLSIPMNMNVTLPDGTNTSDPSVIGRLYANAAAQGEVLAVNRFAFKYEDIKTRPELADVESVKAQAFDWGDIGPSLLAHLARIASQDRDIFRAWHRPEREATEGQHGTKAESETQGEIGTTDSELVASMILGQFNQQVMDRYLVTNYGPDAAGTLYVKQAPLSDPQQVFLQDLAKVIAQNTGPAGELLLQMLDKRGLLNRTEAPVLSDEDMAKEQAKQEAAQKAQQAANPPPTDPNAVPARNGNGNGPNASNGTKRPETLKMLKRILK
jgi:hypothetical protein